MSQILFLVLVAAAVQCQGAHRYYHGRSHGHYRPHDYHHHHKHSGENSPHADQSESPAQQGKTVASVLNGEANDLLPHDVGASLAVNGPTLDGDLKPDSGSDADAGSVVELGSSADKPDDVGAIVDSNLPKDGKPGDINGDNKADDNAAGTINEDGLLPGGATDLPAAEGTINVDGLTPGGDIDAGINGGLPNGDLDKPTGSINVNGLESGHNSGSQSTEDNSEPDQDDNINDHPSNEDKDKPYHKIEAHVAPNNGDSAHNFFFNKPEGNDYKPDVGDNTINVDGLSPGGDDDGKPEDDNNINTNGLSPGDDEDNHYGHHGHGWPTNHGGAPKPNHNDLDASFIQKPDIDVGINGGLPPGYSSGEKNVGLPEVSGHISNNGDLHQKPNSRPSVQPLFPGADILPLPLIPGLNPTIGIPNKLDDKDFNKKNNSMLIPVMLPGGGQILLPSSSLGGIPSYIIVMINGRPTLIQNPGLGHGLSVGGAMLPQWSQLPAWLGALGARLPSAGGAVLVPNSEPVQTVPVPVPVPEPVPAPQPAYNIPYPAYYWPSHWNSGTPSSPDLQKLVDLLINISSRLPKQQPSPPMRPIPLPAYTYPQNPYYPPYPYYPPFVYPGKYPGNILPTGPGKVVPDVSFNITGDKDDDLIRPYIDEPETLPERRPEPDRQPEIEKPKPEVRPEVIPEVRPEIRPKPRPELIPRPQPEIHEEIRPEPRPESRPEFNKEERPKPERDPKHDTHIHITLPKPTHVGKPAPSQPGLDSGLVDILNILLKFPERNSHPTKNLGPLIKLLLSILKPGEKTQTLIPSLNEQIQGQPELGNLGSILLHILDGRKEPNLNVLVEPGMDEATRTNIILLLNLLASNLGGSYPDMGYYQPQNPLLYFLGHFPCDHPNIPAISGMSSGSNLWQLLSKMYGRNFGRTEFRLERSAEETDDKPAEKAKDSQVKSEFVAA
ncbi:hypothetical protein B5X24_HaOG206117 [Helicoverpa armigera]|uniref:Uncharacterized protein n=1 Tax=Helicoverpa armigera TaxID=29058 RepID=A0A2W1BQK2_HELAM|nr:hypothetical protein B5X24_HaOG206117 [Helicoverpa armigera]